VIQNPLGHVTEQGLDRVIIGTPLGQTDPVQVQGPHQPACLLGLAGVCGVAVQGDPDRLAGVPAPDAPHEPADVRRPLAREERPPGPALVHFVEGEQVEASLGLLIPGQDQAALPRVPPAPVRLPRDGLDIEESHDGGAGAVPPLEAEAPPDGWPLRVVADPLAPDAPQLEPPLLSTRRRCSRLMAGTRRWCRRYAREVDNAQRPQGKPRSAGA